MKRDYALLITFLEDTSSVTTWGVIDFAPTGNFPDISIKNAVMTPVCGMLVVRASVASRGRYVCAELFTQWIPRPNNTARIYIPLSADKHKCTKEELLDLIRGMVKKVRTSFTVDTIRR